MKIIYCLPIIKSRKNEVLDIINENINQYLYFEIWLDYIDDLDDEFIKKLIKQLEGRIIFLFRRKNLEKINMSLQKREEIIYILEDSNSYLDLDVIEQKEEIDYIEKSSLKIQTIISYHNYKQTPTNDKLGEITDIIIKHNPKIIKLSTFCRDKADALSLLNTLLDLKQKNKKYIVSGMGENGKIVKIFGALWGNEMTFAPLDIKEASAPGQIAKSDLEKILGILNT
ncbi:MAG TPA: type I 3-dehydroquinate dehydratase [Candidatus Saccharimonadales bacterium]|nr:type I 3-dehydroquinate dehydratase [Candidatus Saccharimonadales bacterium]